MYSRICANQLTLFKATKNGGLQYRKISSKISSEVKEFIEEISCPLASKKNVKNIVDKFHSSLDSALAGGKSSMPCINSYVQQFPEGNEKGKFLALDLGGTNFRSMLMEINDEGEFSCSKKDQVSEEIRLSSGYELFDFMAKFTHEYLKDKVPELDKYSFPTVLTFSFPVTQTAINKGKIISFSKGYKCDEVIGQDLGSLLTNAFCKVGVNINLLGLINDTVGTMLASRWDNKLSAGGIVIGTGTNACYLEKISKIKDFNGNPEKPLVAINTEWGGFGDLGELEFIRTPFDHTLDSQSTNPGKHLMEKMVSGMYMGEICRQTFIHIAKKNIFCSKKLYDVFKEPFSFTSKTITKLEEDEITGNCILCKPIKKYYRQKSSLEILKKELYGNDNGESIKTQDFHVINEVCKAVSERGARMIGIAIACMAQRIDQKHIVFGIDGTQYAKSITYQKMIPEIIRSIVPDKQVELIKEHDGSLRGAAYLAAAIYHDK